MRARTPNRAAQERVYVKLRGAFLAEHPWCVWCGHAADQIHHKRGRVGQLLTAVEHWVAICGPCHRYATEHPAWAYEVGLSERRIGGAA